MLYYVTKWITFLNKKCGKGLTYINLLNGINCTDFYLLFYLLLSVLVLSCSVPIPFYSNMSTCLPDCEIGVSSAKSVKF